MRDSIYYGFGLFFFLCGYDVALRGFRVGKKIIKCTKYKTTSKIRIEIIF